MTKTVHAVRSCQHKDMRSADECEGGQRFHVAAAAAPSTDGACEAGDMPGMHLLTQGLLLGRSAQGLPCSATESMSKPRCRLPLLRLRPRRPSACARPGSDTADVRSRWLSLSRLRSGVE